MHGTTISAIGYECGDLRPVSDLAGTTTADISPLVTEIIHFRESRREIWDLAATAAERTLATAARPDLVVYVSENDPDTTGSLARILDRLGLDDVEHLALSGQDCGNLVPAVRVASDALASGRSERVLLLLADRAEGRDRIMASGLSVFSDGAAACLLSRGPEPAGPRLRVEAAGSRTAVRLADADPAEQGLLSTVRLASETVTALLDTLGRTRADFRYAILPNYRPAAQKFLLAAMRMPPGKLLLGPVTELGHCFSADLLITLHRLAASGALDPGDRLLLATGGPYSWSALAVEYTHDGPAPRR
ncbi:3-oxoacyl-[acyl-carrier-protein] synthase III C-terminal domain-containing protein [Kitasatospora purpeofusca]|uniref:3-oxoacyl-[acyl-carrier-protein] synthase III C-terminal domain-containing protein n=1 Tax=Kitasatospora purpeofusca TaxID=67352 RepID=UPI002A5ADAC6|nr:3-oxoacyl-[acyl-carrier-protein] synthase III C-terminal domain-containing protein [Kitasatospora purpeofusca]MDY0810758.1 3-oxoacyl-[acyl-carrier-protein] synthase III C-terminal domain-containing protein [Kitasatospora purpeofusca]